MSKKNTCVAFSFVVFSFSFVGWGTKNRVNENSSASQSEVTNLVAEFEDHVNLVDKEINVVPLHETILGLVQQIQDIQKYKETLADPNEIVLCCQQINKSYQKLKEIMHLDETYEQQLEKTPELFQIAMNSRPLQEMDQNFILQAFLENRHLIQLAQPYQFHIISDPTHLDKHRGYCFITLTINDHLSEENVFTWDKESYKYTKGFRQTIPKFETILVDTIESSEQIHKDADIVGRGKIEINLTVIFTEKGISIPEIIFTKVGEKCSLGAQNFDSNSKFSNFLHVLPYLE